MLEKIKKVKKQKDWKKKTVMDREERKTQKTIDKKSQENPAEFLKEFEKTREVELSKKTSSVNNQGDINKSLSNELSSSSVIGENILKLLDFKSIMEIGDDLEIEVLSEAKISSYSPEEITKMYKNSVNEHRKLLNSIPKLRDEVEEKVLKVKGKIPVIQQQKVRGLRKETDKKIKLCENEINESREKVKVFKSQLKLISKKFKDVETILVEGEATDRFVMKAISLLTGESEKNVKDNLENFSDKTLSDRSKKIYDRTIESMSAHVNSIKAEIDKLDKIQEEGLLKIKQLEFDFQLASGAQGIIDKEINYAIKSVNNNVEKKFELIINTSSKNVSTLQKAYNRQLIELEETSFPERVKKMATSLEISKLGFDFIKQIDKISDDVENLEVKEFTQKDIQELTSEIRIIAGDDSGIGISGSATKKLTKLKNVKNDNI